MKFSKILLLLIIPLVVVTLFGSNISSVSTVLLGIKGTITDGNLIKFSGVAGVGEDAGVAASNVTKNKFDATSAPTVNNDTDEGYTVGSKWYDVTADKGYACLDNTDGNAVWIEMTSLGTTTFTGLTDTPANYTGEAGKYAKVNVGENALEFDTPAGTTVFTGLTDTPANYTGEAGKYAKVNVGEDALEFGTPAGTTVFTGLTDTPANYTGEAGKVVAVNSGETALEFIAGAGEANTASNIGSEVEIYKQKTGVDLEFRTLKANSNQISVSITGTPEYMGPEAINRSSYHNIDFTTICLDSPAASSGTIETVEIWSYSELTNVEVATFYNVSGDNYSTRDTESIGTVTEGSKQTFSGLSLDVQVGDYIGIHGTGSIEWDSTGYSDVYIKLGDYIPCTNQTFTIQAGDAISIHGVYLVADTNFVKLDVVEENIKLDDLATPDDNTDLDASTTAHGLMPKLPFSGDLLSTTTVAFNADADTTLYTVPAGKRCVLSHAIVVAAGDAGTTTTVSIGANGTETDFIPANTLSNLDAQYDSVILQPIPNTTPLKIKSYAAATVIEAQVASQSGAAGNTIYLFGITY